MTGVAWNVSLLICKAAAGDAVFYSSSTLDCYSLCKGVSLLQMPAPPYSFFLVCFHTYMMCCWSCWCLQAGAKVVGASYGGYSASVLEQDAIVSMGNAGALIVAAAGNSRWQHCGELASAIACREARLCASVSCRCP